MDNQPSLNPNFNNKPSWASADAAHLEFRVTAVILFAIFAIIVWAIRHSVDRALPALPALPALSALLDLQFLQLSQLFQLSQFCHFFHSSDTLSSPSSSNFEIEDWKSWESTYEKSERTNRVGKAGKGGRGREIGDPRKLRELEVPEGKPPSPSSILPPRNVTKLFMYR